VTHFTAWLLDVLIGPKCPLGCGYRARGHNTLIAHKRIEHAGDRP
jgi:hypothetical protein